MAVFYMNKKSTCEHTRLLTVCALEYFTDNTMGRNKNKMELHPTFQKGKKKKRHKRKMNYDPCRN